jgi:hypothetical protein
VIGTPARPAAGREGLRPTLGQEAKPDTRRDWAVAAGLTIGALALYLRTASPTFGGLDAAELATASYTLGIPHATGFPLFLLLGWLFIHAIPFGEVVYRTTLMTALFAALTAGAAYLIARQLRLRRFPAAVACATFAVSYYQWSSATATKEHSLHDLLLALVLWLLLRWQQTDRFGWLVAATGVFGLSLANHMSAALYAPALIVFVIAHRTLRRAQVPALAAACLAGLLPYLYLPLVYSRGPRFSIAGIYDTQGAFRAANLASVSGMWWMVSGRQFGRLFLGVPPELLPSSLMSVAYWLWTSFFGAGVVLGLFGLAALARRNRWFFGLTASLAACHVAFFATYAVPDRDAMFVPLYLLWTLPLGFGIASMVAVIRCRTAVRLTSGALVAGLACCAAATYPRVDRSWDRQPQVWAASTMDALPANSLVFGRWETSGPLRYMMLVKGIRPDVQVIDRFLISTPTMATLLSGSFGKRPIVIDAADVLDETLLGEMLARQPLLAPEQAQLSRKEAGSYPMLLIAHDARRPD